MPDKPEASLDDRIESLWKQLDPQGRGSLDADGLRKSLAKLNHRALIQALHTSHIQLTKSQL